MFTCVNSDVLFGPPNKRLLPLVERHGLAKRVEIEFEGNKVPADQLEFKSASEPWTEYELEDGTVLKLKAVLANVCRLVDRYKPDGEPIYALLLGNLPVLTIPPELKQPSEKTAQTAETKG